ncbi:MAG: HPr family phosphocarrier protein [Gammaproteobacteria bacterium]|nr:HPr family phosphocarrier protein [Gammaproteobacteria bacterium]MDA7961276.1 HPr family phosphocarrier protein [Gammaproteobacteria bacterium]MDA7969318.1 HPr family phosphocarrier protein [Gammaproteobacteria bacterium]MDA7972217.1 HPr family phosphocarrier protein [Gammaproteobacteria bacterium]MDA8015003.1 HPr family phosphocarrier protein [Gammaproteobacteria bacterium]
MISGSASRRDIDIVREIVVVNKLGLHARAAAKLVKMTAAYRCAIRLDFNDKTADAKSIMGVMMLAAAQGSELKLTARGDDAGRAADAVCKLFAERFGEGE